MEPKYIYFVGIGGIGMSALARYFLSKGARVSGYDRTRTALTVALEGEGALVSYEDSLDALDRAADWVVYTPAIPATSVILGYYRDGGYTLMKRSDVLQRITEHSFNICIAGTHGKTTTTTLTAHILRHSGYGCNAFLGGISANYDTNFWSSDRNVCVVEADEYDRSFLKLKPDIAVITAMDPDHMDIYGTPAAMEEAYIAFSRKVMPGGLLLSKAGLSRGAELGIKPSEHPRAPIHWKYSLTEEGTHIAHPMNLRVEAGAYAFDVFLPGPGSKGTRINKIVLHMGGRHNVENTLAAVAVAHSLGISPDAIRLAVADFKGVRRRFEYVVKTPSVVLVDDYAHHPVELRALISGAKDLFPGWSCTVVFQPHLFSRTRDLALEFAASLDLADEVILLEVYPARELPMPGVTSALILDQMKNPRKRIMSKEALLDWATGASGLVIMAGAGDIDALVQPMAQKILQRA